jgi:hypothetical protein
LWILGIGKFQKIPFFKGFFGEIEKPNLVFRLIIEVGYTINDAIVTYYPNYGQKRTKNDQKVMKIERF